MKNLLQRLKRAQPADRDGSIVIDDESIIQTFTEDPNFPFLISFPRTGSHWLRMLMELYFKRPLLVRVFYYPECTSYLALHTHDIELDVHRNSVLYLYRDPIPTIYSQLCYYEQSLKDQDKIIYWSSLYGKHLAKWLFEEKQTEKKTVLRYEHLANNLEQEFSKVCAHFNVEFDPERLRAASERVSKDEIKRKTGHDRKVITTGKRYERRRELFENKSGILIKNTVYAQDARLKHYFEESSGKAN